MTSAEPSRPILWDTTTVAMRWRSDRETIEAAARLAGDMVDHDRAAAVLVGASPFNGAPDISARPVHHGKLH